MIFGLVRLIILSYNGYVKRCKIIGCPRIIRTRYAVMKKLSNKQSSCVIFIPVRLIIL